MTETQKQELCGQLRTADTSLAFLVLLILSICLSWQGTAIQREGLCRVLLGEEKEVPDVFQIRLVASALVVGCLTFFFGLALDTWEESRCAGQTARRSADLNAWASLFVLAAALLRLCDLVLVRRRPTLEEEILPE
ncbi:hypothetical protein [Pseudoflavonifractor phocaeensis]|uniref:hypothetical protein n=1 Tax=Pseudoflavonifractor phocaeensis TaxID=1870988 RepID=UPI001F1BD9A3|nr:hypothetical protein [Pseudoflavonifractor phocaeensis]MCF2662841.1 hypothetical protein [Pseudoflavonifractor phocaeensis]